ncbi:hypothetical protein KCU74_g13, partial [Aureobasidium melanogenum]
MLLWQLLLALLSGSPQTMKRSANQSAYDDFRSGKALLKPRERRPLFSGLFLLPPIFDDLHFGSQSCLLKHHISTKLAVAIEIGFNLGRHSLGQQKPGSRGTGSIDSYLHAPYNYVATVFSTRRRYSNQNKTSSGMSLTLIPAFHYPAIDISSFRYRVSNA